MRRFSGLVILFLILFSLSVQAQSFSPWDVSTTPIKAEIKQGEDAQIELTIINNQEKTDTFRLSIDTLQFSIRSDTPSDYLSGMLIQPHDTRSAVIYFRTYGIIEPSLYQIPITVQSVLGNTKRTEFVYVRVRSDAPEIRDYFAAVDRILKIPAQVDPRQPMRVEINLRNRNPKNISVLGIYLKSNLTETYVQTTLRPLESKIVMAELALDQLTPPQDNFIQLQLVVDNTTVNPIIREPFSIISYSDVNIDEVGGQNTFLTKTHEYKVTNNGNVERRYTMEVKTSFIDSLFTSSTPRSYAINRQDATYLAWDLALQPDETATVKSSTSYLPVALLLLLGIISIIVYFLFRSPLIISKEASVMTTKEGGIAKMKVLIHIKNRSGRSFDKVTIVDKIPTIVEIEKEGEVGTIRPTRIFSNPNEGTTVKWELGSLEKFEERLITYKIRSKLTILGGINLPTGMITYTTKNGKEHIVRSNRLDVSL